MSTAQLLQLPRENNADGYPSNRATSSSPRERPARGSSPRGSPRKSGVKKQSSKTPKGAVPVRRVSSAERRPNTAYAIGSTVQTIKASVMRTREDLDSSDVGEIEVGTTFVVKAIGTGETGRRLLVCIADGPQLEGWISCENAQGECMLKLLEPAALGEDTEKKEEDGFSDSSCSSCDSRRACPGDDKQKSLASRTSEIITFEQASSLGIREEGPWEYICVDPKGIRLRAEPSYTKATKCGAELKFGEVVTVSSRGVADGLTWLCLSDGRGWGFQRTNRLRMSEIVYSDVPADLADTSFILAPKAEAMIPLEDTAIGDSFTKRRTSVSAAPPGAGRASFIDFRDMGSLSRSASSRLNAVPRNCVPPGVSVRILQIASITTPGDKAKEVQKNYYHVSCDGNDKGWLPDSMVIPCRIEVLDKNSASKWISVVADKAVPVCATPSRRRDTVRSLQPGDFVEVEARCFADDLVFFKLAEDGCWICEMGSGNKPVVELAFKDAHNWVYVCSSKDGNALRDAPTRVTSRKTRQQIKNKQRVVVSERAQLASGDVFLHVISPTDGWVPVRRKDGSEKKMQQVNEVERDMDAMTLARMLSVVQK